MTIDLLLIVGSVLVCVWTLIPFFRQESWWIRVFDFPRVQLGILSFVLLVFYLQVIGWENDWDKALVISLVGCCLFHLAHIIKYTPVFPKQAKTSRHSHQDRRVGALVANVLMTNRNAGDFLDLIRSTEPDLVLTLETDSWWENKLESLSPEYPYSVKHALDNLYGMHLYSKLELKDSHVKFLIQDGVPSIHTDVILKSGATVTLKCVHPSPPSPTENPTSTERDAELLLIAKDVGQSGEQPTLVMGDLNDVAWSATTRMFQRLSKLLDPRVGRGMFNTFHAGYPFFRWPLDHVFCSQDFTVVSVQRLPSIQSDHFPIHVVLSHEPNDVSAHEPLSEKPDDHAIASEKIDKAVIKNS